ncbi:choice-of-anchor D domain-containing protein [Myxococcota bacterium]|nr:choice-of-anchor D domain-containing protein [Myxococcota bacterium]
MTAPSRSPAYLLVAGLALFGAACEEESLAKLTIKPSFDPEKLEFGDVTLGIGATRTAQLKNAGSGVFTIDTFELTSGFRITHPAEDLVGVKVPAGGAIEVDVTFAPSALGEATGKLVVHGEGASAELTLSGIGVEVPVPVLAIDPTSLEFGVVEVGTESSKDVTITNTGLAAGIIDAITLESSGASADAASTGVYRANLAAPITVEAGASVTVPIVFRPSIDGVVADAISFSTSGGAPLRVTLNGEGNVTRGTIACAPTTLSFGQVLRGMSSQLQTTCTVAGGPVRFVNATIAAGSDPSFTVINPPGTADLNVGDTVTITVAYTPSAAPATHTGTLDVAYSGESVASTQVALNGEALAPAAGDLSCNPAMIDFGQVERGQSRSLTTVCSANGPARFTGASLQPGTNAYFTLGTVPAARDLVAGDSVTLTVSYTPDGLPMIHNGNLAVAYTNDRGTFSATVPLVGEVIPPPTTATAISIVLTWNTPNTDVDVHLTRPNAITFSPLGGDCYFANMNPDWGVAGDTADNPFLDRDDLVGPGPEALNLAQTASGNYRVWVHYFAHNGNGATTATVQVYVGGNLAGTFTQQLNCNDLWQVGTVNWNGTTGTFAPSTTVTQDSHGFCN